MEIDFNKNMIIQDIFTLINRKTIGLDYLKDKDKSKTIKIIIDFEELIDYPEENSLMNALNYLSILDSKWISIGNEEERLFGVIDFIAFTEFKMRFEISYYYLSEMRRTGFLPILSEIFPQIGAAINCRNE